MDDFEKRLKRDADAIEAEVSTTIATRRCSGSPKALAEPLAGSGTAITLSPSSTRWDIIVCII